MFRSNNNNQLHNAAGKVICNMLQSCKDDSQTERLATELAEAGKYTYDILMKYNFIPF